MTDPFHDAERAARAAALLRAFATRTGLGAPAPPRRYLWTDAFAVCTLLGLARAAGAGAHRTLALRLVDEVHMVLGRHRSDDPRTGWLSGLGEEEGRAHPTRAGLRIGKPLPERALGEPFDDRLEWDRDGQYFHYLTKWMQALDAAARATGEARYAVQACELDQAATAAFCYEGPGGAPRMYWKMSADLTRPLVPSMGQHDPLDGYVTTLRLRATLRELAAVGGPGPAGDAPPLTGELHTYARMVAGRDQGTTDPLGLGGLLTDAAHLWQLVQRGASDDGALLEPLLRAAARGVHRWLATGGLDGHAEQRLAFRELGLALGLEGVRWMRAQPCDRVPAEARARLEALAEMLPLADEIVAFWLVPSHRKARSWMAHEDIDAVMLAAALAPRGVLELTPARPLAAGR